MKQILIIEDDIALQDTLDNLLQLEGFKTIMANNGKKGIELAKKKHPDLIVCDVMMPEVGGLEVISELQKSSTTALIPFIFLTAKTEIKDFRNGMRLGADDYIMKPFNNEELIKAIRFRIDKQQKIIDAGKSTIPQKSVSTKNAIPHLTKREREIVHLFCKGLSCSQISKKLFISFHTVDSHRKNIEKKINVKNIPSIVRFAYENNLNVK